MLELLGWTDYLPQQGTGRNEDIPDHLLFADEDSKNRAAGSRPELRYADALVIEESKRFGLALDARDEHDTVRARTPHGQILRYLRTAEDAPEGGARWGILTNGGLWRLYDQRARPRATGYFEVDLADALQPGAEDDLQAFNLLFRRDSFVKRAGATDTFLERALAEGRRYEQQVAQDLSRVVFERAFPGLAQALAETGDHDLADVRQAALVLLYRLLFLLYAEDRGLLPVNDLRLRGLRPAEARARCTSPADMDRRATPSSPTLRRRATTTTWRRSARLIDRGDASIGLPPYNGGLFAAGRGAAAEQPYGCRTRSSRTIVYDLSHTRRRPTASGASSTTATCPCSSWGRSTSACWSASPSSGTSDGKIFVRPNSYARKDSGSFYTPQELVDLIVDRTLKPLDR